MEKSMDLERKTLINNELTQGKELAQQLRDHLNSISSPEIRQLLVEKILCSYEKAISMLNWGGFDVETKPIISTLESPHSAANSSPTSDVSANKEVYKKRKTQPRWIEQVKVCSGTGLEGPLDDGYNWRKYGQKDILGTNYPRGYYRCTHRHSQGCLATKQVQRSDQDPTIFEVTYRGRHTCIQASRLATASSSSASLINDKSKQDKNIYQLEQYEEKPKLKPKPLIKKSSFKDREGLKGVDLGTVDDIFPSFSFSIGSENIENDIFKDPMMENDFLGCLVSPATSESNYFSMSPWHVSHNFGMDHNVRTPESNSTPTSVTDSPIGDWDISIENVDFDSNFPFDSAELFA